MWSLPFGTCLGNRILTVMGLVLLICSGSVSAQMHGDFISFDDNYYSNSWSFPSYTFESQFNLWTQYRPLINIKNRTAAKANHVRKVTVKGLDEQLLAEFELDTAGNPLSTLYYGKLNTRYHYYPETPGLDYVVSWSRNGSLMRQDFVFSYFDTITGESGPCPCSYTRTVTWKRGFLLNEQNTYYNEKYEDVVISKDHSGWANWFTIAPFGQEEEHVYFSTPFKTHYAPLEMIKTKEVVQCGYEECDACCPENRQEFLVEEAGFYEPVFMQERMFCGNSLYPAFSHHLQLAYNEKGLPDQYFQVTDEYIYSSPTNSEIGALFPTRFKRTVSEKPVYTIEYEYYEE